ncbi:hypothetical protein GIB67_020348 [Kingdonia uniflora]|uniref:Kinesin motor domain-containing protein n=1 Tax=Kingdonia uniflora TaxID=39325 RepID=A0A7J7LRB5_9MAGN|nr:hypothetical protein GIB67_020348 [Kingdonia uniflora]
MILYNVHLCSYIMSYFVTFLLQVYNEQISDLLDPTRRSLQGLSNRKVGASSINSKSSRSDIIFTCLLESWYKGTLSKCFSCSKASRIKLVDLARMEGNKVDDASRQCIKESKSVKKSLAQLGYNFVTTVIVICY